MTRARAGGTVLAHEPIDGHNRQQPSALHIGLQRGSGIPLYIQLKSQLEYQICSGILGQGERLPAIRHIAQELSLSPVTVIQAYEALEAEKLVTIRPGSGTFVAWINDAELVTGAQRLRQLQELLRSGLRDALNVGFGTSEIGQFVYRELRFLSATQPLVLLFIGLTREVVDKYARVLERELYDLNVRVTGVPLDALRAHSADRDELREVDAVVTLLYHLADVRAIEACSGKRVVPVLTNLSVESRAALAAVPAEATLGVISDSGLVGSITGALAFYRSIADRVILAIDGDPLAMRRIQNEADVVVYNDVTPHHLRAGIAPSLPRIELVHVPREESLAALRASLETLSAPGARALASGGGLAAGAST